MHFPPAAYLIGAQKAGTTTLATLLDRHPQIAVSRPKEPDFFTGNWERGWEWYAARFAPPPGSRVLLDASTSYSMAPIVPDGLPSRLDRVPERIASSRGDARFIYILRDPIERAWSAYWHAVRAGWERDGFERAVQPNSLYIRGSRYSAQLLRYLSFFPPERFLCIDFRELRADALAVVDRCVTFLGLEPEPIPYTSEAHLNRSFVFSGIGRAVAAAIGGPAGIKRINRAIGDRLPETAKRKIRSVLTRDIPKMEPRQRQWIGSLLDDEYGAIEDLTGITLR